MRVLYLHEIFLVLALVFTIVALIPRPSPVNFFYVAFACFVASWLFIGGGLL